MPFTGHFKALQINNKHPAEKNIKPACRQAGIKSYILNITAFQS
jgi:hypothetical protein